MSDIHWIASTQAHDNIVTTLEWICSGSTITEFRAYKLLLLYYYLVQNKLQLVNFFLFKCITMMNRFDSENVFYLLLRGKQMNQSRRSCIKSV